MRTYYELSYLDPEQMERDNDTDRDLMDCARYVSVEGDDHAKAVRVANKLADKVGATVQLQKFVVTGERFRDDPLADIDAVGDVEEYEGTKGD